MSKKDKQHTIEPAEDSIGLRMVACSIALLCIITACVYVNTQQLLVFLYLWGALTGSYVSYQFRNQKTFWTVWITSAGLLIVLGNFVEEVVFQYMAGKIHPLVPFIHVLTGLQSLHTFDLRAKSDINISALIGLGLFACTTVLGKDINFAYITLAYISLGAALLYYESVSRTLKAGNLGKASGDPDLPVPQAPTTQRQQTGSVFLALCTVPLLSLIIFFALPRVESLFDVLIENTRRAQAGEPMTFKWVKEPNGLGLLASQNANVDAGDGKPNGKGYSLVPGQNGGPGLNLNQGAFPGAPATGKSGQPNLLGGGKGGKKAGAGKDAATKSGKGKGVSAAAANQLPPLPPPAPPAKNLDEEDKQLIFHNNASLAHDEDVILRVTSSQDTYLRRMCFDKYDGHKWTTSKGGKISKCSKGEGAFQELAGVPSLFVLPQMKAAEISQEITVEADIGHTIPATYIPQRINFPFDPIMIDRFGTLHSSKPLIKGTSYHVTSQMPDYDLEAMRKVPPDQALQNKAGQEFAEDLQLPKELSPAVVSLAKEKAGNDGNWFAKAERICTFLRNNYKYSLDEPQSDQEIAYDFLFQKKQGACGPFATAFIVMCRAVGIPCRCVGGFGPGDFNHNSGTHDVRNKHGHAWAEVYVPGYDWVPFDATPNGMLPKPPEEDHSLLASIKKSLEAIQVKFTPPPPPPPRIKEVTEDQSKLASATPLGSKDSQQNAKERPTGAGQTGKSAFDRSGPGTRSKGGPDTVKPSTPLPPTLPQNLDWHTLVLIPIIVPALMLLFQAMRTAIKQARNRVRIQVEKPKVSTLLFLKVTDDLKKLKINRLPSDTPEELLARFSEATQPSATFHPDLSPLCKRFMELYCLDRFGCDDRAEVRQEQLKSISEQIHELVRANPSKN